MRKVTASAVLLTAITGCAHSEAPTTQWSFSVPDSGEAASSNGLSSDFTLPSALSDEAQAFVDQASKRRALSPVESAKSFRQDGVSGLNVPLEVPAATSRSNAPASNREASPLVTATTQAEDLIATYTAPRPDPVAEARAYLDTNPNTNSPELVTNRTPYSSAQVYLPSSPTAAPLFDLTSAGPSPLTTQVVAGQAASLPTGLTNVEPLNAASALPSVLPQTPISANVLEPTSRSIREVAIAQDVPLGTAILLSRQQNPADGSTTTIPNVALSSTSQNETPSGLTDSSADDPLPRLTPADTTVFQPVPQLLDQSLDQPFDQPLEQLPGLVTTVPINALANEPSDASGATPFSSLDNAPLAEAAVSTAGLSAQLQPTVVSLLPQQMSSAGPTLESLTESMPYREPSPLVAQAQASYAEIETSLPTDDLRSPLLEGLQSLGTSPESAIYLPIAEPVASVVGSSTNSLASSMQGVVSALGNEASMATFSLLDPASTEAINADDVSLESSKKLPSLAQSVAAQIAETSRSISPQSDTAKRFRATTQRAVPALRLGQKLSSKYRHRAFWH